jgi:hypothetical protein
MLSKNATLDFFLSIPDDLLAEIAYKDWESLETLCWALSLELQLLREKSYESSSNRRNMH